jgi:hypothetical protein
VAAKREEGGASRAQVEIDHVHLDAVRRQTVRRAAAHRLDSGIDADSGDVGAVGHPQAGERTVPHRRHKITLLHWLPEGGKRARTRDGLEHQRQVERGAGHRPAHLQRVPHEIGGDRRNQSRRRPEAHDTAEGGGDPERPAQIGALGERDHSGREADGAAPGRAAGALVRVPGIPGAPEHVVPGIAAGRELGSIGLAQDQGIRGAQPFDHQRIALGNVVGVERGSERGAEPGHLGHVLDADRHAGKRADRFAAVDPPLQRARIVERTGVEGHDGVEAGVELGDARERRLGDRDGAQLPGRDPPSRCHRR